MLFHFNTIIEGFGSYTFNVKHLHEKNLNFVFFIKLNYQHSLKECTFFQPPLLGFNLNFLLIKAFAVHAVSHM